tara:strand:- start:1089 stop:1652 length:564 start_codon:yes stop_codon:yes gene_type:complete
MSKVTIKKNWKNIVKCTTDDSRYALGNVYIQYDHEVKGVAATATDGSMLVQLSDVMDERDHDESYTVLIDSKAFKTGIGTGKGLAAIEGTPNGTVTIKDMVKGVSSTSITGEGRYPRIKDVLSPIDTRENKAVIKLSPQRLKALCEIAAGAGCESVEFHINEPGEAVHMVSQTETGTRFKGVLMPIR